MFFRYILLLIYQDMKLLDFTGRKVDPSLMMGFKETKKDEDPNVKVNIVVCL